MDVGLDDYAKKRGFSGGRRGLAGRLGNKASPGNKKKGGGGVGGGTKFNVVGLGNIKKGSFDARQKINQKSGGGVGDARQKINQQKNQKSPGAGDARQKLLQKTKFSDARQKIESKKTQGQQNKGSDMRIKIQNSLANKKVDARSMIKARQQAKQQPGNQGGNQGNQPKVTITGLGRPMGSRPVNTPKPQPNTGVNRGNIITLTGQNRNTENQGVTRNQLSGRMSQIQGRMSQGINKMSQGITRTIGSGPRNMGATGGAPRNPGFEKQGITRTINTGVHPQYQQQDYSNSNVLVNTVANNFIGEQTTHVPVVQHLQGMTMSSRFAQAETTSLASLPGQPMIRIQNDQYVDPVPPIRIEPQVIQPVSRDPEFRYTRPAAGYPSYDDVAAGQEAFMSATDVVSPTQGYRVIISNLHHVVSNDDIVELFGALGAMKKARMVKPGTAEVIYMKLSDAQGAVKKYHMRELDGQPMHVRVLGAKTAPVVAKPPPRPKITPIKPPVQEESNEDKTEEMAPLKLFKPQKSSAPGLKDVDSSFIHSALFKTGSKSDPKSGPVTFTVKI